MSTFFLLGVPGQVNKILQYLEANGVQIDNLALLDTSVSSRAPASTALSNAIWTSARAARLDATVSSTRPLALRSQKFTSSGTWNVPSSMVGRQVLITGVGGGASGTSDTTGYKGGGAGMGCLVLPLTLDSAVSSVAVTVGAGGAASSGAANPGSDTKFGDFLLLRGGGRTGPSDRHLGAKHLGLDQTVSEGFRSGFMVSGGDGGVGSSAGADCADTGYTGGVSADSGGGASAFGNGGGTSGAPGPGAGGHGAHSGSSQAGGDGFLEVFWYEPV